MQSEKNQNNFNILIVDDMHSNLGVLGDILKNEGYRVRPVPNGPLALQAVEKEKPDLILLDIMMPEMDGYEVCKKLKENPHSENIPVIFISALNETKNIVKALSLGGVDYITKPFQAEEVKARVKTQLTISQQNKNLIELNQTKDKFFSIIAHDLRGPFMGFLGLTEIMADQTFRLKREDFQKFSISLNTSAKSLFQLLTNLLEWSRLQQGLIEIDRKNSLLLPVVQEDIESISLQAENKQINIVTEIPVDLTVYADVNILKTVIRNFLSNAVKFTPQKGEIKIIAKKNQDNSVEITIQDSGIGMSKEILQNLFRIDIKTGRKGTEGEPSTGLGLILCKDFIEMHGGTIRVESEVNKGSSFIFALPGENK